MGFNWRSPVVTRAVIFAISIFAFYFFSFHQQEIILSILFLLLSLFQLKSLVEFVERTYTPQNTSLLQNIQFDEQSYSFKSESKDANTIQLQRELNGFLSNLRDNRRERDSEFLFFRNIVMHVGIGLIVFREDGKIEIFNSTARKLLKIHKPVRIHDLSEISATLVDIFFKLKTGGRELLQLKINDDEVQLSVYAIELTLKGDNVKLISIQNIQSELEEKEMEAWQNLVRVLTHEIMNSVTPISSLACMVEEELKPYTLEEKSTPLAIDQLRDIHLSLQTINKRSDGLIHFVKEFRSLTNIPKPRPTLIDVSLLLNEMAILFRKELGLKQIQLSLKVYPEDLTLSADKGMIEQVIINLIKNAIQAFDEQAEKRIDIRAFLNDKAKPVISVKDNGPGIDSEALDKIFIPFFTTKKSGSGIGLSLSRQIMRQHQGSLTVKSVPEKGTEFYLRF